MTDLFGRDQDSEWDYWLGKIADEGVSLTKWEEDFVASLEEQRRAGRPLTERQAEILERIYAEKTP